MEEMFNTAVLTTIMNSLKPSTKMKRGKRVSIEALKGLVDMTKIINKDETRKLIQEPQSQENRDSPEKQNLKGEFERNQGRRTPQKKEQA